MVNRAVRGFATRAFLTGGIILGLVFLARKFQLAEAVKQGAFGLGQAGGQAITQPIAGLTDALTSGINDIRLNAQNLFGGLATAGADVQGAFTGNRDAIGDFFNTFNSEASGEIAQDNKNPPRSILSIDATLSPNNIARRISNAQKIIINDTRKQAEQATKFGVAPGQTTFGGFGSGTAQETALQKLIAENVKKFPQFFKVSV